MNEAEAPAWVKYAGDLFFLIIFLVNHPVRNRDKTPAAIRISTNVKPLFSIEYFIVPPVVYTAILVPELFRCYYALDSDIKFFIVLLNYSKNRT